MYMGKRNSIGSYPITAERQQSNLVDFDTPPTLHNFIILFIFLEHHKIGLDQK